MSDEPPESESVEIDVSEVEGSIYRILSSVVIPRPIAWISTTDGDGVDNLAPYSFSTVASVDPPIVLFAPVDDEKDSPTNASETGEFVFNLVTEDVVERMNETAATLPADESEFDRVGLDRAESTTVEPPRVAAAKAAFECTLHETIDVGGSVLVLGEVEHVHLDPDLLGEDGKIDVANVDAVGRLAGSMYATTQDRFGLERPP
ncbi:flavin reductase family protein [Halostagnicola kamekurae]|uniref:NADH-FMN oxidoreductase RutF, flavin reductase (DIM6/NTAB) family n=1 Tax=Halostagnicola kamekurae TaxID=619731 RepID=A0A1I6SLX5_9EURY|nr:flavin reductase family protein [Halostagnicola kamekurae]SFS77967.1 NADH-FMN oxidoreductase RutF, flavin reductase (DIM6/NTAB) family [Halostagnicola kamekurae]